MSTEETTSEKPGQYPLTPVPKKDRGKQCMIDPELHKRLRGYARENTLHIRSVVEHSIEAFLVDRGF